jgi:DNA-directed RNA polymerase specialized sigma24 family protein
VSGKAAENPEPDYLTLQQRLFQVAYMMLADQASSEDIAQESVARIIVLETEWHAPCCPWGKKGTLAHA